MWVIYNWLAEKYRKSGLTTRKNLDFSKQTLFGAAAPVPGMLKRFANKIHACCVKKGDFNNRLILQRVFFGRPMHPPLLMEKQEHIDFFSGEFENEPPAALTQEERVEKLTELLEIRHMAEKEFGGPQKNEKKWLYYLGPEVFDSPYIEYCCNNGIACPLLK